MTEMTEMKGEEREEEGNGASRMLDRLVSAHSLIHEWKLHADMRLQSDLGVLPVDALEIFDCISNEYGIDVSASQIRRANVLGDLQDLVGGRDAPYELSIAHKHGSEDERLFLVIGLMFLVSGVVLDAPALQALGVVQLALVFTLRVLSQYAGRNDWVGEPPLPPCPPPPPPPPRNPDAPVPAPLRPAPQLVGSAAKSLPKESRDPGSGSRGIHRV